MEKVLQEYFMGLLDEMKKSNYEADNAGLLKDEEVYVNQTNFLKFIFFRLFYEDDDELIKLYNKEFQIGLTGEYFQKVYLVCFDRIFKRRFDMSPIGGIENKKVFMKGKVSLFKGRLVITETKLSIVK
jgi:hypothetical protein